MTDALAPIAEKIKRYVRLLASNRDGEVTAAARALNKTLLNASLDMHALADSIGSANGKKFSEEEARQIYFRGVEDGKRQAEREAGPIFHGVGDDEPSWHEIAVKCAAHPRLMHSDSERKFVHDMVHRTVHGGEPTQKQAAWLRKIYARTQR